MGVRVVAEYLLSAQDVVIIDRLLSCPVQRDSDLLPHEEVLRSLTELFPGAVSGVAEIDGPSDVVLRTKTFPPGFHEPTTGMLQATFAVPGQRRRIRVFIGRVAPPLSDRDRVLFRLLTPRLEAVATRPHGPRERTALSSSELRVLTLVAQGLSNTEVSKSLCVTVGTTRKHLEHIYTKLGVRNRTAAVAVIFPRSLVRQ